MNAKSKSTLEKFEKSLRFKNYSERTIQMYLHYSNKFLIEFDKDIYHISQKEAINYLMNKKYTSISQQNQIINSVKLLYKYVVGSKIGILDIERPRKEKRLPQIISQQELLESISKIENIKHKAIISLAYGTGMRVSEICNLKIEDIDSKRMIVNIRQAKGNKDRITPLSQNNLELLREYYKQYKPEEYLFNGQFDLKYSHSSCNQIVKKYLGEDYHFHLLRHSYATTILENGTDLRIIQKLLGHQSSKTTEVYTHVSTQLLNKINLPI